MITAGLELQNSLNSWKKVSKVRNTARRPASKMLKLDQQPGNGSSPKRVDAPEVLEHEKPQKVVFRRRSSASIEHVPIKKRRYILRSPSPPSISQSQPVESQELYDGVNDFDRQSSLDSPAVRENVEFVCSKAEGATHSGSDMKSSSEKHGHEGDFSAITMLADAACSNILENSADGPGKGVGVDVLMQEGESNSVAGRNGPSESLERSISSPKAREESIAPVPRMDEASESLVTSDSLPTKYCKMDGSLALQSTISGESNDTSRTAEETSRSSSGSRSRDDRFHWDLNVPMDEWDEPEDDETARSGLKFAENTSVSCLQNQNLENVGCSVLHDRSIEMETCEESTLLPNLCEMTSSDMPSGTAPGNAISNPVEHGSETSEQRMNFISSHAPDASNVLDLKVPLQMETMESGINSSLHLQSDDQKQKTATNCNEPIGGGSDSIVDVAQSGKSFVEAVAESFDFACKQEDTIQTLVDKFEIPFFHGSESLGTTSEPIAALSTDVVGPGKNFVSSKSENEFGKVSYRTAESFPIGAETIAPKEPVSLTVCKSEDSSLPVVAAQSVVHAKDEEVKEIVESSHVGNPSDIPILEQHITDDDYPDRVDIRESNMVELHTEDLLEGGFDSHISHEDHSRAGVANVVEVGYDSHLEDGELREPMGLLWENEVDEAERVDYDSDTRDGYETDSYADPVLSLGRTSLIVDDEPKSSLPKQTSIKDDQLAMDISTSQHRIRSLGSLSAADTVEPEQLKHEVVESRLKAGRKTGVGSNGFTMGAIDASEKAEDTLTEVVGVTASKRELLSYKERPGSSDKKSIDPTRRSRSNTFTSKHDEDERHTGSDDTMSRGRSSVHLEGRDRPRVRSFNYGLKSAVANSDADDDRIMRSSGDSAFGVRRPTTISSTAGYSRLVRNGLESGNDDEYVRGKVKLHNIGPDDGIRGRFDRYSGINSRRYREGYRRPGMYENADSAGVIRSHFSRRERSFSPICNRVDHLPQGHRRSRSRSRSRSPDFRSEARQGRMRIPYPSNNHIAVHMRDRRSPPARVFIQGHRFERAGSPGRLRADNCVRPVMRPVRFSDTSTGRRYDYEGGDEFYRKPHPSRSQKRSRSRSRTRSPEFRSEAMMGPMRVSYQSRTTNHMRDRRSPVRVFRPAQRFDSSASPGRMRGEDHVRPIMRSARFSDASHSGRVNEYEDDELRRKPRKIFGRGHQIRNFEVDDEVRRFQYDAEDDNVQQNFRNTERRSGDVLRNNREERGSTRYNSDRMY